MKDLLPQGPVLALSSILDYSRTACWLNEKGVILRELFVRRKPLTGALLPIALPILLGPRKTGKTRFPRPAERDGWPHSGRRAQHRECLVKIPVNLVNACEEDMRGGMLW